jgi:hypothetical protein
MPPPATGNVGIGGVDPEDLSPPLRNRTLGCPASS